MKTLFLILLLVANSAFGQISNTWLQLNKTDSYLNIGDLDITGNQLTIEAVLNGYNYNNNQEPGHLISKHTDQSNVNYALSAASGCEITTDITGYVNLSEKCKAAENKTYHVAMVYDGKILKYFRNGYLVASKKVNGNIVTNNLPAYIGQISGNWQPEANQFYGYITEVRFWNIARTQAEIQEYIDKSLPNPKSQNGLVAYYTFDNLKNKQGNSKYDGKLEGNAAINKINPQATLILDSCGIVKNDNATLNNWLFVKGYNYSNVTIGDLDVEGNQLTVEVKFNSIKKSSNGSWGHLISKHTGEENVNYAVSPNGVEITTTNGYYVALQQCAIELNKTYHVALVYDGNFLKFYRNGILIKYVACTGNLVQNDLLTTIANIAGTSASGEQFNGYINDISIWNVARTEKEINSYKDKAIANPKKEKGLLAYYQFNDLSNKKNSNKYNAILYGNTVIQTKNPNTALSILNCDKAIKIEKKPIIDFNYIITNCNNLNLTITKIENATKLNWLLNGKLIGDETLSNYKILNKGKNTITLKAWSNTNNIKEISKTVVINTTNASFTQSIDSAKLTALLVCNTKTNPITNSWYINDAFFSSKKDIVVYFNNYDSIKAKLVTSNEMGCVDSITQIIYKPKPLIPKFDSSWLYVSNSSMSMDELFAGKAGFYLNRAKELQQTVSVKNNAIIISIFDNASVDGDKVSLFLNKQLVAHDIYLSDKATTYTIELDKSKINELEMIALNEGAVPPNTASLIIDDGGTKTKVKMESTNSKTSVIRFVFDIQ